MSIQSKIRECIKTVNYSISDAFVSEAKESGLWAGRERQVGDSNAIYFAKAIKAHLEYAEEKQINLFGLRDLANNAIAKAVKI